jgi:hypothetical protein
MTMSQQIIDEKDLIGFSNAVDTWVASAKKFIDRTPTPDDKAPSASDVVHNYFDVLKHIWFIQWDVTRSFLPTTKAY